MTLKEVMEYECKTCSFFQSFIFMWFPSVFVKRCQRKLKRYNYFKQEEALHQAKEILNN